MAKVLEFQFLISLWLWRFNEMWQSLSLSGKFNDLTMHWVFLKDYNHWMLVWCCSIVLFQKVYKSIFIPNGLPQFYFSKQMSLVLHPYFNFSTCKRCFIHDLHLEDLQFFSPQTDRGINGDESGSSPLHLSSLCKNTKLCPSPQWCNMAFFYCLSREYIGGVTLQTCIWKFQ